PLFVLCLYPLLFHSSGPHRHPHSFPTRRSSDDAPVAREAWINLAGGTDFARSTPGFCLTGADIVRIADLELSVFHRRSCRTVGTVEGRSVGFSGPCVPIPANAMKTYVLISLS